MLGRVCDNLPLLMFLILLSCRAGDRNKYACLRPSHWRVSGLHVSPYDASRLKALAHAVLPIHICDWIPLLKMVMGKNGERVSRGT